MQTFKPNDTDKAALDKAAQAIKAGNLLNAQGKKLVDAGKAAIETWLKDSRQCDLATLGIGDLVSIDTVCLVEIGKQNRFDEGAFQLAQPEMHAKYKKDFPTKKFKPLV